MKAYFVQINGRAYGPLDLSKLQALAKKGRLNENTLVKVEPGGWQAASTISDIFCDSMPSEPTHVVHPGATDSHPKDGDGLTSSLGNGLPDFELPDFSSAALQQNPEQARLDTAYAWQQVSLQAQSRNQSIRTGSVQVGTQEQADAIAVQKYLKPGDFQTDLAPAASKHSGETLMRIVLVSCLILVILVPTSFVVYKLATRNSRFQDALQQLSFNDVIAKAYYRDFGNSSLVFDINTRSSTNSKKIDALRLLLEFSGEIDLAPIETVYLARNGRIRYQISAIDIEKLSDEYKFGDDALSSSAVYSFPEFVLSLDGESEFPSWEGGVLGVRAKQVQQLNAMLDHWLDN